ncbi:unnamed protein product [Danaus chrysippus]|uniref:(African queen) hypothetical protein n=1 Tax=Danaus chrysippus TaxID=151541 RepID=A0A8J2QMB1_9NEOP|nr:unnamed protein product [Danaus chrysippus]
MTELPSKPVIFDEFGKEITESAGPFHEGGAFKLICSVNGGNPTPRLQWLHGETVVSSLSAGEMPVGNTTSLTLLVTNATRAHLSAVYTCSADNTLLSPPQRVSVRVDLYLRPLSVEILSREQPLSVGRQAELWCNSTGARPPAAVTWWLDDKKLESITKQQDLEKRNETQSVLKWTPSKEQNGKILTCRAEHSKFNSSTIESNLLLNIFYVPVATMHLGAKINSNDIEEGDDMDFGCEVDANPPAYKVVWEHNGILLQHSPANGVILTGNTNLALRNVSRHQAGNYTCTASNVEGDGKSLPVQMQVVYRPVCRSTDMKIIGAALQEPSKVECEVDAFPPPETFEWTLNNSEGSIKVDPERFNIKGPARKSVLTFVPVFDTDYGKLSCRATNLAGQQMLPCVYTILPATRPDPPSNCSVYNLTDDSLDLTCIAEAQEAWEVNWAVGGVLGAAFTVAFILCLAIIASRLRHSSRDYGVTVQSTKNQKMTLQKRCSPDNCNPDLIPLSQGPAYKTFVIRKGAERLRPFVSHSMADYLSRNH